jgi:phage/plasmid-like protein (TIGR03299 family)
VVCNNTLSAAVRGAGNIFKVKHTVNAESQLVEVQRALGLRQKYREKLDEAMKVLTGVAMTETQIMDVLATDIFPEPKQTVQKGGNVVDLKEVSKKAITVRKNKINKVLELVENGAGADIPGVKGTAYGLYQALTEWTDHEKSVKVVNNRVREEVRFENAFWGTGAQFKEDCFKKLLKMAA